MLFFRTPLPSTHRCTRVENPGEGVRDVFAKIPGGGQGFQEKLPGGPPILRFIAFLLTSFSKICLGGCCFIPPLPPLTPPPVYIYASTRISTFRYFLNVRYVINLWFITNSFYEQNRCTFYKTKVT